MQEMKLSLQGEFIRLDSLLKWSGAASTGGQAKWMIQEGLVSVNGEICTMRGKKLRVSDVVTTDSLKVTIE